MSSIEMSEDCDRLKQEQRTFLRERFLRMLGCLAGLEARVDMYDKTAVTCRLGAADVDFHHLQVSHLATPMGVLPKAMLRTKDIMAIVVDRLQDSSADDPAENRDSENPAEDV